MLTYKKLQKILERYDEQKGRWRKAFFDHADVRALRSFFSALPKPSDMTIDDDRPLTTIEIDQLKLILSSSDKLIEELSTKNHENSQALSASDILFLDIINELDSSVDILAAMRELQRVQGLYTPENIQKILVCQDMKSLVEIMHLFNHLKTNSLNQTRFDILVRHVNLSSVKTQLRYLTTKIPTYAPVVALETIREVATSRAFLTIILISPILLPILSLEAVASFVKDKLYYQNDNVIDALLIAKVPDEFMDILRVMSFSDYTKRNLMLIAGHTQPIAAGVFLKLLDQNLLAIDKNLKFIQEHDDLQKLLIFLRMINPIPHSVEEMIPRDWDMYERLGATHLSLKLVLKYADALLLTDSQLLQNLPSHLRRPTTFRRLLGICERFPDNQQRVLALNNAIRLLIEGGNNRHHRPAERRLRHTINYAQSTHAVSVHTTVSESAIRLKEKYRFELVQLEQHLQELQDWLNAKPDIQVMTSRAAVARRALNSAIQPVWHYVDNHSQVTIKELLVLCWVGIRDIAQQGLIQLADGENRLLDSLYESQRMYNLDDHFIDDHPDQVDRPACLPGIFNKLMECLAGTHPLVSISFVTRELLALKLPIIVAQEAHRYIQRLIKKKDFLGRKNFAELLEELKVTGIDIIFEKIRSQIAAKIRVEYGAYLEQLFRSEDELQQFINSGIFAPLTNLERYDMHAIEFNRFSLAPSMFSASSSSSSGSASSPSDHHASEQMKYKGGV